MFGSSRFPTFAKPLRFPVWIACMGIAFLLVLSGCTRMQVKMGMKVELDKIPISTMQASLPKSPNGMAPGDKSPLVVMLTDPSGKVYVTQGQGGGIVQWQDLKITNTVVNVSSKGIVSLSDDPRDSDGETAHITVTVPSHPDLRAELDIPLRYDKQFVANFSGYDGSSGMSGQDGMNGTSGSMGSTDINNPQAGGDGSDGTNGSDGQDGGNGGNAGPVQVRVTAKDEGRPLLQVEVSAVGENKFFLVDPKGGSLMVRADGGRAGSGGRAGRCGSGGSGGMGSPSGRDGRSGSDGRNGFDGTPGAGGLITVTYDPKAALYMGAIHLSNVYGPAPVFREEPVPALW